MHGAVVDATPVLLNHPLLRMTDLEPTLPVHAHSSRVSLKQFFMNFNYNFKYFYLQNTDLYAVCTDRSVKGWTIKKEKLWEQ